MTTSSTASPASPGQSWEITSSTTASGIKLNQQPPRFVSGSNLPQINVVNHQTNSPPTPWAGRFLRFTAHGLHEHSFTFRGVLYRLNAGWSRWIWGIGTYWHRMGRITQSRPATFGPPHYPGHPRLSISCREVRNLARWRRLRLSQASAEVAAGKPVMNVSSKRWVMCIYYYAILPKINPRPYRFSDNRADVSNLDSWDAISFKRQLRHARVVVGLE